MKMVRSLLLGSAAGLVAVAGAQAADLPLKAKPVEYVKVCSIYGAGFYYLPGTDTCLKVGGYVRLDIGINAGGSHAPYVSGVGGQDTRQTNQYESRVRGIVSWDARTQTEYGTLRAYINAGWELNSGDANYRGVLFTYRAFIQFAGLTAGKTQSFFGFYANALNFSTLQGGGQSDAGLNLLAYTAQFGGGFSATLSLEDGMHHRGGLWDATISGAGALTGNPLTISALPGGGAPFYGDYGGNKIPDIVGNLRVDQPWGSVQLAGAFHNVNAAYAGSNTAAASPSGGQASGWAASGGVKFNLPWAQGDEFWLQGTYAQGATNYLGLNPFVHSGGQFAMYSGGRGAANQSVGLAWTLDGVFDPTGISLTTGWSVLASLQHFWTPSLRTSVFGHYTTLDYGGAATAKFCAGAALTPAAAFTVSATTGAIAAGAVAGNATTTPGAACNPDFAIYQIGTRTIWSPVRNLDIGVELLYTRLDQNFTSWTLGSSGARPAGVYAAADQDIWSGTVRFQRNFWP